MAGTQVAKSPNRQQRRGMGIGEGLPGDPLGGAMSSDEIKKGKSVIVEEKGGGGGEAGNGGGNRGKRHGRRRRRRRRRGRIMGGLWM